MPKLDLIPVIDKGLGNSTYLLDLGAGRTLVIDSGHKSPPQVSGAARKVASGR